MKESDSNFPIEVDSRLVMNLQRLILWIVKGLAILMTLVILWGAVDIVLVVFDQLISPPYLMADLESILHIFGGVLVVLIAIEIFVNIILYLRKDIRHLRLVIATALMAIARKVIIMDYNYAPSEQFYGIAAIILALGIAYWLSRYTSHPVQPK